MTIWSGTLLIICCLDFGLVFAGGSECDRDFGMVFGGGSECESVSPLFHFLFRLTVLYLVFTLHLEGYNKEILSPLLFSLLWQKL